VFLRGTCGYCDCTGSRKPGGQKLKPDGATNPR
jgi:hypothetical protein